jgi:hypothetical protein
MTAMARLHSNGGDTAMSPKRRQALPDQVEIALPPGSLEPCAGAMTLFRNML